jgi:hypothetical protein
MLRQPLSKYSLRYDKLLVDKDVYVFNELSGSVELVGGGIQEELELTATSSPTTPYRFPLLIFIVRASGEDLGKKCTDIYSRQVVYF